MRGKARVFMSISLLIPCDYTLLRRNILCICDCDVSLTKESINMWFQKNPEGVLVYDPPVSYVQKMFICSYDVQKQLILILIFISGCSFCAFVSWWLCLHCWLSFDIQSNISYNQTNIVASHIRLTGYFKGF